MPLDPLVAPGRSLSVEELGRYSRQVILPELGLDGQRRLASARVLVVGAGGLGSPALLYLAAAGVGTIGIVDSDAVEASNLHRQVIHPTAALGRPKVASAAAAIGALNPNVVVVPLETRLDAGNIDQLVAGYDVVLDGADNFPTRYLVNDACARAGVPLVWGSVLGFSAQVAVFWDAAPGGEGVQLRDVFPVPPAPGTVPSCAEAGVIGAVCGQVGSVMAGEAIKLITGIGEPLLGRLLVIDVLRGRWDEVPLRRSPARAARPAPENPDAEASACAVAARPASAGVDPGPGAPALAGDGEVLLDVRSPAEFAEYALPGSVNVPLQAVLAGELPDLPGGRGVLVICRSGARAEVAAAALTARGIPGVRVLAGGLLGLADDGPQG